MYVYIRHIYYISITYYILWRVRSAAAVLCDVYATLVYIVENLYCRNLNAWIVATRKSNMCMCVYVLAAQLVSYWAIVAKCSLKNNHSHGRRNRLTVMLVIKLNACKQMQMKIAACIIRLMSDCNWLRQAFFIIEIIYAYIHIST